MTTIYVPSAGPTSWKPFLADPDKHWKPKHSAYEVAHAWEAQAGWPPEIANIVEQAVGQTKLLLAIPEHKTPLPGGRRESQSDVFALGRHDNGLIACTIEGKAKEPFGPTVADQMKDASPDKQRRLDFLCKSLGLQSCPGDVYYQLLHRTVSALIESNRFAASHAAMIVHSFSPERLWFDAYARFVELLGGKAEIGVPTFLEMPSGQKLILGWACGNLPTENLVEA